MELDDRSRSRGEVAHWRERWAAMQNTRLAELGIEARVDHRSLEAQGIERDPEEHLGPAAAAMARRGAEPDRTRRGPRRTERTQEPPQRERQVAVAGRRAPAEPRRPGPRIIRAEPSRYPHFESADPPSPFEPTAQERRAAQEREQAQERKPADPARRYQEVARERRAAAAVDTTADQVETAQGALTQALEIRAELRIRERARARSVWRVRLPSAVAAKVVAAVAAAKTLWRGYGSPDHEWTVRVWE